MAKSLSRAVVLEAATKALRRGNAFDAAWFAERVDAQSLLVGYRSGAVSERSDKTLLRHGQGLGGRAFALNKVEWVNDYLESSKISHHYDDAIAAESFHRLIAAPVWVENDFVGVIMAASREHGTFGNRAASLIEAAAQRTSDELLAALESTVQETALQLRTIEARHRGEHFGLRRRERDVLFLVAVGKTNREIAETMHLSENTVKSYLRNLMNRLGARNRTEATMFARNAGLL